jgi:cathepsin L
LNSGVKVTGWKQVGGGESGLANTIGTVGPVTAYIFAGNEKVITKFSLYKGGIYSDPACAGQQTNHAVNLVGYTSSYYILRNSWGTGWGLSGYMYIQRGNNMCQVASYNLYPTVSYSGISFFF